MNHKQIRDAVIVSQHCQRNYDLSASIPQEDIDTIIFATTNCPSKQNLAFYNIVAIQDREVIEKIHEQTLDLNGSRTNPQVLGQLLLVFTRRDVASNYTDGEGNILKELRGYKGVQNATMDRNLEIKKLIGNKDDEDANRALKNDANVALGIAAGYCNLVSSQLGYRTGCSSCFNENGVHDILKSLGIAEKPMLLMGIGVNDESRNRREHHKTGKLVETFVKVPIKVDYV